MDFRFVGSESEVGRVAMDRFGQRISFDEATAAMAILGGCGLCPAKDFDAIGFTVDELAAYQTPGAQALAPESFHAKKRQAQGRVHVIRESLEAGVNISVSLSPNDQGAGPTKDGKS